MNYKELARIGLSKVRVVTDILILIDVTLHVIRLFNEHVRPRIKKRKNKGCATEEVQTHETTEDDPKGDTPTT
jgi:hypothetical protein